MSDVKEINPELVHVSKLLEGSYKPLENVEPPDLNVYLENGEPNTQQLVESDADFVFDFDVNTAEIKLKIREDGGATVLSQAFDACRRSWHLKLDVTQKSLGVFLVERGKPKI